ncbi:MAG: translocation/assembly module TamB, partial [Duncaniella sp.]|nr:translocation/assembly module TamB [Duncaniella sp.]
MQEDLVVQLSQIHLQDWLVINPFAPPVKGDVSADMRLRYDDNVLTAKGNVELEDLYYGKDRVGTFGLDVNVANSAGGKLMADVALMVDSVKTITATGVLNDSTSSSPFLLDFNMIKFPLKVVNPFIPQGMASLTGTLNGQMKISGEMSNPIFDGFLDFDSTTVKVQMLGTSFAFSEDKIPVDSNVVKFENFAINGCNENPLYVNGTVGINNLTNVAMDLALNAKDIQVVNSDRPKGAEIFGKAFLDLDAKVKGNMNYLNVDADLALLSGTNVTYVVTTASQSLTSQDNSDLVHFVQFNDTLQTVEADSLINTAMSLNLDARLHIEEGSTINVYLNTNGSNRAQVLPSGDVTYTMSALNGDRVTGRININGGYVRYTPPLMSEKYFKFEEGSYIAFNGNMLNPILNITAVDEMKANVTQSGQNSRLVNFDVMLSVTNTLQDMNVAFDLSTDDDITVQNELASMSQEQRANQAMNLLLYNVYTGADTKASANLSGNPLYS